MTRTRKNPHRKGGKTPETSSTKHTIVLSGVRMEYHSDCRHAAHQGCRGQNQG